MWYIKYFGVKLNILVLTPLVWIEKKYNEYKEWRLKNYVEYMCMIDNMGKIKSK